MPLPPNTQKTSLTPIPVGEIRQIQLPFLNENERGKVPDGFSQIHPLSIEDCERLAAQHSPLSAVLEAETGMATPCRPCSRVDTCVLDSVNSILQANSGYQRNLAAEKALIAYLGMVEVYLQNNIVDETIEEIDELKNVLAELQQEGLLRKVDPELLTRKKLDALANRTDLLFSFEKLNENLRGLLGLESTVQPIWTDCQIPKWDIPSDLNAEIEVALNNRSDLAALHRLTTISNDQILETLRSSVRSASPLAGLVLERRLFGGFFADHSAEIAKLRMQMMILHEAQKDLIRSNVSEQFYAVFKHHEQINLKLRKLESLNKSQARLEAQRQVGPIDIDEVLTVKSDLLKCRSELISAVVQLQVSWIQLKSAQGLLGRSNTTELHSAQPLPQKSGTATMETVQRLPSLNHPQPSLPVSANSERHGDPKLGNPQTRSKLNRAFRRPSRSEAAILNR